MTMRKATVGEARQNDILDNEEARRLDEALRNGGWLEPIDVPGAPLDEGEFAYADLEAEGWRYHAMNVLFDHRTVMVGGPVLFAATGIASALANRRRRKQAEALAAPQWRPLGHLRVVVTSDRLLVQHRGIWWPVWYSGITGIRSWADHQAADLFFTADLPYRLIGPGVVGVATVLSHRSDSQTCYEVFT